YTWPKQADFQSINGVPTRGDRHRVEQNLATRLDRHEIHLDTDRCGCRIAIVCVGKDEGRLLPTRGADSVGVDVECRANHCDAEFGAVFVLVGECLGQEGCGVLTNEHSVFSHRSLAPRASATGPVVAADSCQFWRIFCPLMTTSADPLMVICLPSI